MTAIFGEFIMASDTSHARPHSIATSGVAGGYDPTDYGHVAPDCENLNFYDIDPSLRASLRVNAEAKLFAHFEPCSRPRCARSFVRPSHTPVLRFASRPPRASSKAS